MATQTSPATAIAVAERLRRKTCGRRGGGFDERGGGSWAATEGDGAGPERRLGHGGRDSEKAAEPGVAHTSQRIAGMAGPTAAERRGERERERKREREKE